MGITEMRPSWRFGGPRIQKNERQGAFIKQPWTLSVSKKEEPGDARDAPHGLEGEKHINAMYSRNREALYLPLKQLNTTDYLINNKFPTLSRSLDFEPGLVHREYDNLNPASHIEAIERDMKSSSGGHSKSSDAKRLQREDGHADGDADPLWKSLANRRMYRLCHQYESIWKPFFRKEDRDTDGASEDNNFPYVEETASLVPDLSLKNILHSRHKTRSRRHPKWLEVKWFQRKWHNAYLHRRRLRLQAEEAEKVSSQSIGLKA